MATGNSNLYLKQGDSFLYSGVAHDDNNNIINLSGYTGFAAIKTSFCTGYTGVFDVQFLDFGAGVYQLSMAPTGTAALPVTISYFDFKIASGAYVATPLKGYIYVEPQVSVTFP